MPYRRLYILQIWLRRLFLLTLAALVLLTGLSFYQGTMSWDRVGRMAGRMTGLPGLPQWRVAIIAGHRGFDTGAVCPDGLMEVQVTQAVANRASKLLQAQGAQVEILDEYDKRLNGLAVDALLSIHVDSCIDLSGFKVASGSETVIPEQDAKLVSCLKDSYAAATELPLHPTTITRDMTGYHAFQRVADSTPGAIIELGFLGGDRDILVNGQAQMAQGVANGIVCFLQSRPEATATPATSGDEPLPSPTPGPE